MPFRDRRDVIVIRDKHARDYKSKQEYAGDAVMKLFEQGKTKALWFKATGRAISKAVEVAMLVKERMGLDFEVKRVEIGSIPRRRSGRSRSGDPPPLLSTIQIQLGSV